MRAYVVKNREDIEALRFLMSKRGLTLETF
ncbi:hypothetical protein [Nostoc sp.]